MSKVWWRRKEQGRVKVSHVKVSRNELDQIKADRGLISLGGVSVSVLLDEGMYRDIPVVYVPLLGEGDHFLINIDLRGIGPDEDEEDKDTQPSE